MTPASIREIGQRWGGSPEARLAQAERDIQTLLAYIAQLENRPAGSQPASKSNGYDGKADADRVEALLSQVDSEPSPEVNAHGAATARGLPLETKHF